MASSANFLVPMTLRIVRHAFKKAQHLVRTKVTQSSRPLGAEFEPIFVRNPQSRQPVHPAALLRQASRRGRWFSTRSYIHAAIRNFGSAAGGKQGARKVYPASTIGNAVNRLTSRAPFASTLRPNLTGGALPRTAGGYSMGAGRVSGARYFSHTPAAPAEIVSNVSAAVLAFLLSGQRAQYNGIDSKSGAKRYRAVSDMQERAVSKMRRLPRAAPGSFIDFRVSPTITAISPLNTVPIESFGGFDAETVTLNTDNFLELIGIDFSRALKDLSAVLTDLKRLSVLGDLNITLHDKSTLRVHLPGCDARTVANLCDELGVQRGFISEDPDFDASAGAEMALTFPFAPSELSSGSFTSLVPQIRSPKKKVIQREAVDWQSMLHSPAYSTASDDGFTDVDNDPWGNSSVGSEFDEGLYFEELSNSSPQRAQDARETARYEGLEGIYRFLEECDGLRR